MNLVEKLMKKIDKEKDIICEKILQNEEEIKTIKKALASDYIIYHINNERLLLEEVGDRLSELARTHNKLNDRLIYLEGIKKTLEER